MRTLPLLVVLLMLIFAGCGIIASPKGTTTERKTEQEGAFVEITLVSAARDKEPETWFGQLTSATAQTVQAALQVPMGLVDIVRALVAGGVASEALSGDRAEATRRIFLDGYAYKVSVSWQEDLVNSDDGSRVAGFKVDIEMFDPEKQPDKVF